MPEPLASHDPESVVPGAVKTVIGKMAAGNHVPPQLGDLALYFFAAAGGPVEIARMLYQEYEAARPGSLMRQRILDMILKCLRFENEQNPRRAELGTLSDEDLEKELADVLQEIKLRDPTETPAR